MKNLDNFFKEIDEFQDEVKDEIRKTTKRIVRDAYTDIIQRSPVDRGSFLLSNRIGIGVPISHITMMPKRTTETKENRRTAVTPKAMAYMESKLGSIKKKKLTSIHISNSVGHADQVEFGGVRIQPYAVYQNAANHIKTKYGLEG